MWSAESIVLTVEERGELERRVASPTTPQRDVKRAQVWFAVTPGGDRPVLVLTRDAFRRRLDVVERADRANGGICVDLWHHERGAKDMAVIRELPAERIMAVQLNDGAAAQIHPDYKQDCLRHRLPPGDGTFDIASFLGVLRAIGNQAPLSLEVCQERAWGQPPLPHVQRCADGLRAVMSTVSTR